MGQAAHQENTGTYGYICGKINILVKKFRNAEFESDFREISLKSTRHATFKGKT